MEELYIIQDAVMDSLRDFDTVKSGHLDMGELEALKYATGVLKNINFICQDVGNSYANRGRRVRHSREDGERGRGMGRSRNSYGSGREEMMEHVYAMEESADNDRDREMVRRFREQLERV